MKAFIKTGKKYLGMIVPALEAAEALIAEGKDEEAMALLANVPLQSKAMILSMKDFLEASGDPEAKEKAAQIMADEFPVRIGFTEQGWFGIHMMPLAKTPDSASKEFVREILTPALKKFFADKPTIRYPECVVCFRHVYDRNCPESGKRDYNNAEVKLAKDLVAMYVMRDDNPRYCDTHCMSAPGKEPHTEIYIVPRAEYPNWLMEKANIPDDGMPLTDQIPERYSLGF